MKVAFTAGTRVRFNIPDGALAEITDYRKSWDWRIPGYLGDGFYLIRTIPEQRQLIAHEDDLVLAAASNHPALP
jgi:hypothetical protein